ncbi:MAG: hypothetical protein LBM98_11465 [Oscillospiraceae bacterium]|nr:hypothetical protein [Oscillospiraceae bacterium]
MGEWTHNFVGAGFKPALVRGVRRAAHRHCEAPVRPRYVGRYRCEAIQCREHNIRTTYRRILRQPWIASPHIINYVSQVRWRLRKDGQGFALPCPGAMRRDGGRGYAAHGAGNHPAATRHPSQEGNLRGRERGKTTPVTSSKPSSLAPLWRGAARRRRGGSPAGRNPRPSHRL